MSLYVQGDKVVARVGSVRYHGTVLATFGNEVWVDVHAALHNNGGKVRRNYRGTFLVDKLRPLLGIKGDKL